ncbi:MAG: FAD-dependent oxidoreductase [Oscillospiraceae bacterium]|jgi:hypothetical protein|nr:FAD-dependent oxidoreductase [Oscillospiraceae bacterium]
MYVTIPERTATVKEEADLLVVGGGPAGIAAAIAGARQGLSVVLLERRGFLGGTVTGGSVGLYNHFTAKAGFATSGIARELETQYRTRYGRSFFVTAHESFHTEYLKIFLDDFVLREKIKIYFHSFVSDVLMKDGCIDAVLVHTKQGATAFKARMVIDATGDGDIAYFAGVPYKMGRKTDGLCQPGTLMFAVAGVDVETFRHLPGSVGAVTGMMRRLRDAGIWGLSHGRIPSVCSLTEGGIIQHLNFTELYGVDATDSEQVSAAEIRARRQIEEVIDYMRKNIVGMENIELAFITPEICFRESRRIDAEYELTFHDIENDTKFDDGIALFPRFYDMHSVDNRWEEGNVEEGVGNLHIYGQKGRAATIPYRCLVPVKAENLLVTGRCICADPVALSCIRQVQACIQTGQAAATAMAMAIKERTTPRKIDTAALRQNLSAQGMAL